jgi:hypothetical protein
MQVSALCGPIRRGWRPADATSASKYPRRARVDRPHGTIDRPSTIVADIPYFRSLFQLPHSPQTARNAQGPARCDECSGLAIVCPHMDTPAPSADSAADRPKSTSGASIFAKCAKKNGASVSSSLSFVQGRSSHASSSPSFVQGRSSHASSSPSFVQGRLSHASSSPSFVQGRLSHASSSLSFVQGRSSHACSSPSLVQGCFSPAPSRHRLGRGRSTRRSGPAALDG